MRRVLTELTDHERAEAMARVQVVRPFLEENGALTDIARQHAYPLRPLRRWVQCYRAEGLAGLVRMPRRDRGTRRRLPPVLHQCVEGLALQRPPLSIAAIHRQVSALAQQAEDNAVAVRYNTYVPTGPLHPVPHVSKAVCQTTRGDISARDLAGPRDRCLFPLDREAASEPVQLPRDVVEDRHEPQTLEPPRSSGAQVSLVIIAVDDYRSIPVEHGGRLAVELFERNIDRTREMFVVIIL